MIVIVVKRRIELRLASSGQNPDELLMIIGLLADLLVQYFSLGTGQCHVHLWSLVPVSSQKRHQKLRDKSKTNMDVMNMRRSHSQ